MTCPSLTSSPVYFLLCLQSQQQRERVNGAAIQRMRIQGFDEASESSFQR
jgi:hypothetical protein